MSTRKRNERMFARYTLGDSLTKIAEEYGISRERTRQIVRREQRKDLCSKQYRDERISKFGTWSQTVCLLLPHLQAIKAIAEEKDT